MPTVCQEKYSVANQPGQEREEEEEDDDDDKDESTANIYWIIALLQMVY